LRTNFILLIILDCKIYGSRCRCVGVKLRPCRHESVYASVQVFTGSMYIYIYTDPARELQGFMLIIIGFFLGNSSRHFSSHKRYCTTFLRPQYFSRTLSDNCL
jgi:hypothetical protein